MSLRSRRRNDENELRTEAAHKTIRANYDKLTSRLPGKDLIPKLFAQRILGDFEKQEIDAVPTSYKRNQLILGALEKRNWEQFQKFLQILKKSGVAQDLVDKLQNDFHANVLEAGGTIPGEDRGPTQQPTPYQQPTGRSQPMVEVMPTPVPVSAVTSLTHVSESLPSGQLQPPHIEPPDSLPIDRLTNQQCQAIVFQLISSNTFKLVDWHLIGTRMNEANLFTEDEFYKVVNPRIVNDRNRVLTESASRIGAFWLRTLYASLYSTMKIQGHVDVLRSISQRVLAAAPHMPMAVAHNPGVDSLGYPPSLSSEKHSPVFMSSLQQQQGPPSQYYDGQMYTGFQSTKEEKGRAQPTENRQSLQPSLPRARDNVTSSPVFQSSTGSFFTHQSSLPRTEVGGVRERSQPASYTGPLSSIVKSVGRDVNETLILFIQDNNIPNAKRLFETSFPAIDLRARDVRTGKTALILAAERNLTEIMGMMLQHPTFDPTLTDANGMTVLHVAAGRGLDGMLLMFYSGSAQTVDRIHQVVNLKDKDGRTALHHAASGGHLKVCQILVEHGKCDVNVVDNSRQTPFQLAGMGRHKEVVAYLASFDPTKATATHTAQSKSIPVDIARLQKENADLISQLREQETYRSESQKESIRAIRDLEATIQKNEKALRDLREENQALRRGNKSSKATPDLEEVLQKTEKELRAREDENEALRDMVRKKTSEIEDLKASTEPGQALLPLAEQEHSPGTDSQMLVTGMLYGYHILKRDKLERQKQVQRSDRHMTQEGQRLYLELEQENTVLKSTLANNQTRISHLENEIQKHHIRENLISDRRAQDEEDSDRQKYAAYRKEDLIEEVMTWKRFNHKYEVVALESKSYAQRYNAEVDVEKAINQSLKGKIDLMRTNWENRIRALKDENRRLHERVKSLEEKSKKKGKDKSADGDVIAALPNILKEGTTIILTKHSQFLSEHRREQEEREKEIARLRNAKQLAVTAATPEKMPAVGLWKMAERPSPLGIGNSSETQPPLPMLQAAPLPTTDSSFISALSYVQAGICGRAKSISELVHFALIVGSVQVVSAPLFIADSTSGIATKTLVRSALDVPQGAAIYPSSMCFNISLVGKSCHLIGPLPSFLAINSLKMSPQLSFLAAALPRVMGYSPLPPVLQPSNLSSSPNTPFKGIELSEKFPQFNKTPVSVENLHVGLLRKLSAGLRNVPDTPGPPFLSILPCVSVLPSSNTNTLLAAVRVFPLLLPSGFHCLVRMFASGNLDPDSSLPSSVPSHPVLQEYIRYTKSFSQGSPLGGFTACVGYTVGKGVQKDEALTQHTSELQKLSAGDKILSDVTFSLSTRNQSEEEIGSLLDALSSITDQSLTPHEYPLRWLYLLDLLQESGISCPDLSSVVQVAVSGCHMKDAEVPSALSQLAKSGYILFYPDCKPLKDVVFVDKSVVLGALVELCSQPETMDVKSRFHENMEIGVVNKTTIQGVCRNFNIPYNALVSLLLHKCVFGLTRVVPSGKLLEAEEYFFPALIPPSLADHSDDDDFMIAPEHSLTPSLLAGVHDSEISYEAYSSSPILLLCSNPAFIQCIIPAVTQSLSRSKVFPEMHNRSNACNKLTLALTNNVVTSMVVFDSSSHFLPSESGLEVKIKFPKEFMEVMLRHLLDAVSLIEAGHGGMEVKLATLCPNGGNHAFVLQQSKQSQQGRYHCGTCQQNVQLNDVQEALFILHQQILKDYKLNGVYLKEDKTDKLSIMDMVMTAQSASTQEAPLTLDHVKHVACELASIPTNGHGGTYLIKMQEYFKLTDSPQKMPKDLLLNLLLLARGRGVTKSKLAEAFYNSGLVNLAYKVNPEVHSKLRSASPPSTKDLTEYDINRVSDLAGSDWEILSQALHFDDVDSHLYSDFDYTPSEACSKMLMSWLLTARHGAHPRLILADCLNDIGYVTLAISLRNASG